LINFFSQIENVARITQDDLVSVCLLYDHVRATHLSAGTTVVTYAADTGRVDVAVPASRPGDREPQPGSRAGRRPRGPPGPAVDGVPV
jgi:hypothetical protein